MSTLPLVKVTARLHDQVGAAVAGATVRMKLTTVEKYCGLVVPRETSGVTDANGCVTLKVFPNELGSEGSEYCVHITTPSNSSTSCCSCTGGGSTTFKPLRFHVTVPNCDCNLFDIVNLPPYEHRGAGQLLPTEVSGYAADAADSCDQAARYAEAAAQTKEAVDSQVELTKAIATSAQASADAAATSAKQAKDYANSMTDTVRNFNTTVIEQTALTCQAEIASAKTCVEQAKADALNKIIACGEKLNTDTTSQVSSARSEAIAAINTARVNGVHGIEDAYTQAKEDLQELAAQYDEDFNVIVTRANDEARKAACAAASACQCASQADVSNKAAQLASEQSNKAEASSQNILKRVEVHVQCTNADAGRAEAAAKSASNDAQYAAGSALSAQKSAEEARTNANLANTARGQAVAAQQAAAADKAYVKDVRTEITTAVKNVAIEVLVPEIITDAAQQSTRLAKGYADLAVTKADEASKSAQTAQDNAATAVVSNNNAQIAKEAAEDYCESSKSAAQDAWRSATQATQAAEVAQAQGSEVSRTTAQVLEANRASMAYAEQTKIAAEDAATSKTVALKAAAEARTHAEETSQYLATVDADSKAAQQAADEAQRYANMTAIDHDATDYNLKQVIAARQAVAQDRLVVEAIKDDAETAIANAATEIITPQVVSQAIDGATDTARLMAQYAAQSADTAESAANTASQKAAEAKTSADSALASKEMVEQFKQTIDAKQTELQKSIEDLTKISVSHELAQAEQIANLALNNENQAIHSIEAELEAKKDRAAIREEHKRDFDALANSTSERFKEAEAARNAISEDLQTYKEQTQAEIERLDNKIDEEITDLRINTAASLAQLSKDSLNHTLHIQDIEQNAAKAHTDLADDISSLRLSSAMQFAEVAATNLSQSKRISDAEDELDRLNLKTAALSEELSKSELSNSARFAMSAHDNLMQTMRISEVQNDINSLEGLYLGIASNMAIQALNNITQSKRLHEYQSEQSDIISALQNGLSSIKETIDKAIESSMISSFLHAARMAFTSLMQSARIGVPTYTYTQTPIDSFENDEDGTSTGSNNITFVSDDGDTVISGSDLSITTNP